MKTYDFDAFGNALPAQAGNNGQEQTVFLYSGAIFDPALAAYYLRATRYHPAPGRFASPDIHVGEASAPAQLRRFGCGSRACIAAALRCNQDGLVV